MSITNMSGAQSAFMDSPMFQFFTQAPVGKRIVAIGDLILDEDHHVNANGVVADSNAPIFRINRVRKSLGGAANLAHNLVTLGALPVVLIGVLGTDTAGTCFLELAEQAELITEFVFLDKNRPTTQKNRIVSRERRIVCRIDQETCEDISSKMELQALAAIEKEIPTAQASSARTTTRDF